MEKLFINNRRGLRLSIQLTLPRNAKKLVFLEHGTGARKEYPHMAVLEKAFAENGFNVVNIDASDSLNESESSPEGLTFSGHYNELEDVIEWAKTQSFYTQPFALAGQSLGAAAIVLYAGRYPKDVNLLITAAFPWLTGRDAIEHSKSAQVILEKGFYDQISKSTGRTLRLNRNYIDDIALYDFTEIVKNISAETYVIVGTKDTEAHIESNKKLFELLKF